MQEARKKNLYALFVNLIMLDINFIVIVCFVFFGFWNSDVWWLFCVSVKAFDDDWFVTLITDRFECPSLTLSIIYWSFFQGSQFL